MGVLFGLGYLEAVWNSVKVTNELHLSRNLSNTINTTVGHPDLFHFGVGKKFVICLFLCFAVFLCYFISRIHSKEFPSVATSKTRERREATEGHNWACPGSNPEPPGEQRDNSVDSVM